MRISDWSSDVCSSDLSKREAGTALANELDRIDRRIVTELQRDGRITMTALAARVGLSKRSEEHTSELQSLMRISYAVFCLKKKLTKQHIIRDNRSTT